MQSMAYTQITTFSCCCFSDVLPMNEWLLMGRARYLATESVKNFLLYLLPKKPSETRCWSKGQ